jgi:hypothetical protein
VVSVSDRYVSTLVCSCICANNPQNVDYGNDGLDGDAISPDKRKNRNASDGEFTSKDTEADDEVTEEESDVEVKRPTVKGKR